MDPHDTFWDTKGSDNPLEWITGLEKWTHFGGHICTDHHNIRTPLGKGQYHGSIELMVILNEGPCDFDGGLKLIISL